MHEHKGLVAKLLLAGGLAIAINSIPFVSPAISQEICQGTESVAAASTTKTVTFQQFGIQVKIPSNYRTMLRNDGSIEILPPGDFNLLQCIARGIPVLGTDAISSETFRLLPNPQGLTAKAFALQDSGKYLSANLTSHKVSGIDVSIREGIEMRGFSPAISSAWYQPPGIEGIVQISVLGSEADILDILNRSQIISATHKNEASSMEGERNNDLISIALHAVKEHGGGLGGRRRSIVRENDSAENPQLSTITIIEEGFLDDSVRGHRFIVKLNKDPEGNWAVVDIQKSWVCQQGRGSQTYSRQLCH